MARHQVKFKKKSRLKSTLFMLLNTLVWGAALIIVKPAFDVTTPFRFLLYRFFIASSISLPLFIYYLTKIKNLKKIIVKISLIEILGGTIGLSLLYTGLSLTSAIEASLIATTLPIFVAVLAVIILKEKEEKNEITGLLIAFLGTLILTLWPLFAGHSSLSGISLVGNLFVVGQNIAIALYYVLVKKYYQQIPKVFIAMVSFFICLLTFAPLAAIEAGGVSNLLLAIASDLQQQSVWIAGIYMGIFGSIIGYTAYLKGQEGIEASEATLFTYLQPLVYLPLGIMLLGENIHPLQIVSLVIIGTGVLIAERRKSR